jgi:hypothetical protein
VEVATLFREGWIKKMCDYISKKEEWQQAKTKKRKKEILKELKKLKCVTPCNYVLKDMIRLFLHWLTTKY